MMSHFALAAAVYFLVGSAYSQTSETQSCYYPDGTPDNTLTPCKTAQSVSACCGTDAVCLTNGLCLRVAPPMANRISRAGCTDETWKSNACPLYCTDGESLGTMSEIFATANPETSVDTSSGVSLFLGPETIDGTFCCGLPFDTNSEQCQTTTKGSTEPFPLPAGAVQFDRYNGASTDPAAFGSNGSSSVVSGIASTATVTHTATPSSSSLPTGREAAVGAGVGVPLFIALLVALGFLFHQRSQRKKLEEQLRGIQGMPTPHQGHHAQQHPYQSVQQPDNLPLMSGPYVRRHPSDYETQLKAELSHENAIAEIAAERERQEIASTYSPRPQRRTLAFYRGPQCR